MKYSVKGQRFLGLSFEEHKVGLYEKARSHFFAKINLQIQSNPAKYKKGRKTVFSA
jgi:hypothetical protein